MGGVAVLLTGSLNFICYFLAVCLSGCRLCMGRMLGRLLAVLLIVCWPFAGRLLLPFVGRALVARFSVCWPLVRRSLVFSLPVRWGEAAVVHLTPRCLKR